MYSVLAIYAEPKPSRDYPMKTRTKSLLLTTTSYTTAIALAGFSGAVATYGMTRLVPGGELVVAGMGVLFEAGKLSSYALLHRKAMPRLLKIGLATVGLTLMTANIAGVSGFLSKVYERRQISAQASEHVAQANAYASADIIERQLAAAVSTLAAARTAQIKARDDKARAKAAKAIVDQATAERDALAEKLTEARIAKATAEGDAINASAEFAAIAFIAQATGASTDKVAHAAIFVISAVPDCLAVLLLLAAGCAAPRAPSRARPVRKAAQRKRHYPPTRSQSRRSRLGAVSVVRRLLAPHPEAHQPQEERTMLKLTVSGQWMKACGKGDQDTEMVIIRETPMHPTVERNMGRFFIVRDHDHEWTVAECRCVHWQQEQLAKANAGTIKSACALGFKNTRRAIRALGLTASRRNGEWRVNLPGGSEATAYYTNDNDDALATAKAMAAATTKGDNDNAQAV
jgi:hypothetical protein